MQSVGMTKGGFYKHFDSKEVLAQSAFSHAIEQTDEARTEWTTSNIGEHTLEAFAAFYLSALHRDSPGKGCPISTMAIDIARTPLGSPLREQYHCATQVLIKELMELLPKSSEGRRDAMVILSTLVGALTIARATTGLPLSKDMLNSAKEFFTRWHI